MKEKLQKHNLDVENLRLPIGQEEFRSIIESNEIQITDYLGRSFNITFIGHSQEFGDVVLRFSESVPDDQGLVSIESSGYFDDNKHNKEIELSRYAHKAGLSVPKILKTGTIGDTCWSLQQKAEGMQLNNLWNSLNEKEQHKALFNIGEFLGKLHSQCEDVDNEMLTDYWREKITTSAANTQELGILSNDRVEYISDLLLEEIDRNISMGSGLVAPVHLELLTKHTFVDSDLNVTGVIDWETGEVQGDPLCDIAYTAFWNSGEGKYTKDGIDLSNEPQFDSVIDGYGQVLTVSKELILEVLPAYDAAWYMNILWIRASQGNNENTERRKNALLEIVDFIGSQTT